jgi:hypothetical protein
MWAGLAKYRLLYDLSFRDCGHEIAGKYTGKWRLSACTAGGMLPEDRDRPLIRRQQFR